VPNVPETPDVPDVPRGTDPSDASAKIERRDFGHMVFVIGTDAAAVGRAVRDESVGSGGRVLAFVGSPDHPALSEMLTELAAETPQTPGS
jgi:hypothetical protein